MTPDDVAILMQDLLDSDEVAVYDSFFDAGGTSMTALTLISEVQRLSGVSLSLLDIVRNPTPDGIARLITQYQKEAAPASRTRRERHGSEDGAGDRSDRDTRCRLGLTASVAR